MTKLKNSAACINIRGAKTHNLKDIDLEIPKNKLVVITGVSGSGKSSLAFDTVYAEGQRRYVESLSAYARQFLELMDKPDVESIEGLSPAIAIEQKPLSRNPRSTVATQTEIYDYLRLLFARAGTPHCVDCKDPIKPTSASEIVSQMLKSFSGNELFIYAPIVRGRTGTYQALFSKLKSGGWVRARVDGDIVALDGKVPVLSRYVKHTIEIEIDRIRISSQQRERLAEGLETAFREGRGLALLEMPKQKVSMYKSQHLSCPKCGTGVPDMEPRLFSFNSPYGACPECEGLGIKIRVDEDLVVTDPSLSLRDGAISAWSDPVTTRTNRWKNSWREYYDEILEQLAGKNKIPMNVPWKRLSKSSRDMLLYGGGYYKIHWAKNEKEFEGVIPGLQRRTNETESEFVKEEIMRRFMRKVSCPACHGKRLKKEALSVLVSGMTINQVTDMSITQAIEFFENLRLGERQANIARLILKEIKSRLSFLENVGLSYITLNRKSQTLAGGEAQRIHLATQIGSGLTGVLYVMDEPTIGLHPKDTKLLLQVIMKLRDQGNTLILVEHDEETIRSADWIVDLGPGGGETGGSIVFSGTVEDVLGSKQSLTARYLNRDMSIALPQEYRKPGDKALLIHGARQFNLKDINVKFPLGVFACVTGVSGSGKSTLVYEVLYKACAQKLYGAKDLPGLHDKIAGLDHIDKVLLVDQSPIGRTPRSNPATYTEVWSPVRELFSLQPLARRRGYKPGRFSFNVPGGRCEHCKGDGLLKIEMQFLADVYVICEVCRGKRFNEETLDVRLNERSISDILNMSVAQAAEFFKDFPKILKPLKTMNDIGLGYIRLGQSATTLSGGEAQRIKLAAELCKRATGKTLYILDEPTTGLHFDDVRKLLKVLNFLVDDGNTVLVIEHNLDVIKSADWIVDLGPDGGDAGGCVVACGNPREVAGCKASYTGNYLRPLFLSS
ncbi:excinuclease ABC subunit UvrA [Elusimicrobiota bacterium]